MQKRSYESINSLGASTTSSAVHTPGHPTPVREVIVTPTESMEDLREEDGGLVVKPNKERPTSVGTVAFGTR